MQINTGGDSLLLDGMWTMEGLSPQYSQARGQTLYGKGTSPQKTSFHGGTLATEHDPANFMD